MTGNLIFPVTVGVSIGLLGLFYFYVWKKKANGHLTKVLLFPDSRVPCRNIVRVCGSYRPNQWRQFMVDPEANPQVFRCRSPGCDLYHGTDAPLVQLMMTIANVRRTLDVCVYTITHPQLIELIVTLNSKRRIAVRVITDQIQQGDENSRVEELRQAGIEVRMDTSTFYMHHKFCLIDSSILLTGSLNWSRAATVGNCENVIITDDSDIVGPFTNEFARLWAAYASAK